MSSLSTMLTARCGSLTLGCRRRSSRVGVACRTSCVRTCLRSSCCSCCSSCTTCCCNQSPCISCCLILVWTSANVVTRALAVLALTSTSATCGSVCSATCCPLLLALRCVLKATGDLLLSWQVSKWNCKRGRERAASQCAGPPRTYTLLRVALWLAAPCIDNDQSRWQT